MLKPSFCNRISPRTRAKRPEGGIFKFLSLWFFSLLAMKGTWYSLVKRILHQRFATFLTFLQFFLEFTNLKNCNLETVRQKCSMWLGVERQRLQNLEELLVGSSSGTSYALTIDYLRILAKLHVDSFVLIVSHVGTMFFLFFWKVPPAEHPLVLPWGLPSPAMAVGLDPMVESLQKSSDWPGSTVTLQLRRVQSNRVCDILYLAQGVLGSLHSDRL